MADSVCTHYKTVVTIFDESTNPFGVITGGSSIRHCLACS